MKKMLNPISIKSGIPKFDLKMKLSVLFLFAVIFTSQANTSYSQATKITLKMQNSRVIDVLDEIELKTEFNFIFNTKSINLKRVVSVNYKNQNIEQILSHLFKGTTTDFKIDNRKILLLKKQNVSKEVSQQIIEVIKSDVTGTVKDTQGFPLPAASIIEKGTTNGTETDFDGNFTLETQGENPTLVISYLGYETQEIVLNGKTKINVILQESAAGLDEVILIGYGSVTKRDATGAVSTIKAETFNVGEITSPEQLIQGKSAGVQITTDGGEPGGNVNVRIRGTSSVRSGNGPLYVVNGFPLNGSPISPTGANVGGNDAGNGNTTAKNPLAFLNPNDIESIDILKDASSTAIYGSRGANGVIIITTKSPKIGKRALTYTSSVSTSTITQKLPLLSASEFVAAGGTDLGSDTDWQDQVYRTAFTKNHHLSFGGGTESGDSQYVATFGVKDQEGIVRDSGTKVYSGTLNTSYKLFNDKLKLTAFVAGSNIIDDNPQISNDAGVPGDLLGAASRANPTQPIFNPDGTFVQIGASDLNPAAILAFSTDRTNTFRTIGNFAANYKVMDNLSYKFNFGIDRSFSQRNSAISRDLVAAVSSEGGIVTVASVFASNLLLEHTLDYNKQIGDKGKFSALVGYSYQNFKVRTTNFTVKNFQTSDLSVMLNNLESATTAIGNPGEAGSSESFDELQSFFGRINYSHAGKYLLTATLRSDGSSKFGENKKVGYFPSVALGWRISDEEFMPEKISNLKLRIGYGITGNQEFPGGSALPVQRFGIDNTLGAPRFANRDLVWEETTQLNAGLDYGFFDDRLRGSFDVYRKITTDLLVQQESAQPAPAPFFFGNLDAEVVNSGVEIGIDGDIIDKEDFTWTSSFNIGFNKNEVTKIDRTIQTGAISGPGLTGAFAQVITQGQPLYTYFISEFNGFDENGLSIESPPKLIGKSPLPDYTFGFNNSLKYKNWDLNVFFTGQVGGYIYNNNANALFFRSSLAIGGKNVTRNVLNTNESDTNGNGVSTRFLEDGSFIRLQNVTLGYNFDIEKIDFIRSLRLSLTGQNLLTITDYTGQDPEVNVDKNLNGVPSLGIDYSAYPRARTFLLGLTMSF